jgi:S1-C subfamily serine protease
MLEAGARRGSLLFRGQSIKGQYFGTAIIFDNRCGQYTYHVSGPILDGYERVVLKGQAPRIGPDCNVEGYFEDILDFRLVKPIGTPQPPSPSQREQPPSSNESRSGTGFYVSNDGYLITNEHVVNSCSTIKVVDATGDSVAGRVVRTAKPDDLALLKTNVEARTVAVFRDSGRFGQGATVYTYGYPLAGLLASSGNVSTGVVTALSGIGDNPRQMQISAPVQPGDSGSPLVDIKGAVIGVVVAKLNAMAIAGATGDIPQNINFAIKASAVIDLLDANSVKYHTESLQLDLSLEELTQQMKKYTVRVECN